MEDGQESVDQVEVSIEPTENSPEVQPTEASHNNPFWGEVEEKVGPDFYKVIEPLLQKADTEANKRITSLNETYKPWKQFQDQGIEPDQLTQAMQVIQHMNENPVEVFNNLKTFLEREGRLPNQQELANEVADDDEEEDPRDTQLRQLQENQEKLNQYLESQALEQERYQASIEAEDWINKEIETVKAQFPHFSKEDMTEVFRIAAGITQNGQEPNLVAVATQWNSTIERIRTTPRASANAPRVPGGVGGAPQQQAENPSTMTPEERVAYMASRLG